MGRPRTLHPDTSEALSRIQLQSDAVSSLIRCLLVAFNLPQIICCGLYRGGELEILRVFAFRPFIRSQYREVYAHIPTPDSSLLISLSDIDRGGALIKNP